MKTEENVYEKENQTEGQGVECANENEASAVLGKFKDVNALARAYEALQAEFTRRSQRLKVLEKEAEKSPRSGAEKLRKNAEARREESKRFDEFVASATQLSGQANPQSQDPASQTKPTSNGEALEQISVNGDAVYEMNAAKDEQISQSEAAETERKKGVPPQSEPESFKSEANKGGTASSVAKSDDATDSSALLYAKVCQDEKVRLRIIGEYLSSIGRAGAPLMTGGAGTLATPPLKAKSIYEAGDMALRFFKKPADSL